MNRYCRIRNVREDRVSIDLYLAGVVILSMLVKRYNTFNTVDQVVKNHAEGAYDGVAYIQPLKA